MRFSLEEIEKFDSLSRSWWDKEGPFRSLHKLSPLRLKFILSNLPTRKDIPNLKILDIGCGGGIFCEALSSQGFLDVTGIDISVSSIKSAEDHASLNKKKISYIVSDTEKMLNTHSGYFDVVTCMEVLEHVPRPEKIIEDCSRLVKNSGMIFFSTLNRNLVSFFCAIFLAENLLQLVPKGMHEYEKFITPYELYSLSRENSLFPKKISGIHYNVFNNSFYLTENFSGVNYLFCFKKEAR